MVGKYNVSMGIVAFIVGVAVAVYATIKNNGLPESVSEIAYIIPHWAFTVWIAAIGFLVMPGMMDSINENWQWIGFLSVAGLMCVAASAYYKTESKILHYIGGCLCALCATVATAIIEPYLLLGWIVYPAVVFTKSWLFWGEVVVFTLLLIAIN